MTVQVSNNAAAALASSITNTATSLTVQSGQGALFPSLAAGQFFFATLVDASNNLEIIKVTARASDTLTIVRGQDGTTGKAYAAGDKVELRLVAAIFSEFIQRDGGVDFTGQITVPQGTAAGKAINASRQVLTGAGSGLQGGGNLTADLSLSLTATGVTAGSKGSAAQIPVITVDAQGRVTALTGVALDLSTKADVGGGNASGTWPISITGSAPWANVTGKPTALSQFTNDVGGGFFYATGNCANFSGFPTGNTGNCRPMSSYGVNQAVQQNCGNIQGSAVLVRDDGVTANFIQHLWNYNCNCNCCCCC